MRKGTVMTTFRSKLEAAITDEQIVPGTGLSAILFLEHAKRYTRQFDIDDYMDSVATLTRAQVEIWKATSGAPLDR